MKELDLGKEKIPKLIKKFAIPCIISLVVNALYNMVDQVFIGRGVGYLGNGATNVVFPLTMVGLAFALMFGDGTSAYLSLKLGEQNKKDAEKGVGTGIVTGTLVSVILFIIMILLLPQILNLFGCTDALRDYALSYGRIIVIGLPFMMVGTILNSIIRADGSPKYSMTSMVIGAVLNIILDPIFIFDWGLNLGVTGAAIATALSQFVTCFINILYIRKFKTVKITKESFKPNIKIAGTIASFGVSSFITQMAIVVVVSVQNSLLKKYGVESKFGAEIPITVLGIVMKINQIICSVVIGIAAGSQPIVGYNYGAKKYDRVKKTLKYALIIGTAVCIVGFILFQTIPEYLIGIFGSGDALYNEFACLAFRIFLLLIPVVGVQIISGIFFQAIGEPMKSAFLTLSRQILFFIPAAIILSNIYGIMGVLYAGPVSDGISFICVTCFLIYEFKKLNNEEKETGKVEKIVDIEHNKKEANLSGKTIIAISREYGSGGRFVAQLVAEKLGLHYYDKDLINITSSKSGYSAKYIENNEQKLHGNLLSSFNTQYYDNLSNDDNLYIEESKAIQEVAEKGNCVIVGRCATYVLKDHKDTMKIFLFSDDENKVKRAVEYYGLEKENALKEINKINKNREKHYNYYTGKNWRDFANYDYAFNVDKLGVEKTAEMIIEIVSKAENKVNV